jgi:hypothetical protein
MPRTKSPGYNAPDIIALENVDLDGRKYQDLTEYLLLKFLEKHEGERECATKNFISEHCLAFRNRRKLNHHLDRLIGMGWVQKKRLTREYAIGSAI